MKKKFPSPRADLAVKRDAISRFDQAPVSREGFTLSRLKSCVIPGLFIRIVPT